MQHKAAFEKEHRYAELLAKPLKDIAELREFAEITASKISDEVTKDFLQRAFLTTAGRQLKSWRKFERSGESRGKSSS